MQTIDTLLYANEMNKYHALDKKLQYDFYFYAIPAKKRWSPWAKKEELDNFDIVKEYYKCGNQKAKEYLKVLTSDQIEQLRKRLTKGGIVK
jgi:hypothetical protein